jgi:hypothetical protein
MSSRRSNALTNGTFENSTIDRAVYQGRDGKLLSDAIGQRFRG